MRTNSALEIFKVQLESEIVSLAHHLGRSTVAKLHDRPNRILLPNQTEQRLCACGRFVPALYRLAQSELVNDATAAKLKTGLILMSKYFTTVVNLWRITPRVVQMPYLPKGFFCGFQVASLTHLVNPAFRHLAVFLDQHQEFHQLKRPWRSTAHLIWQPYAF